MTWLRLKGVVGNGNLVRMFFPKASHLSIERNRRGWRVPLSSPQFIGGSRPTVGRSRRTTFARPDRKGWRTRAPCRAGLSRERENPFTQTESAMLVLSKDTKRSSAHPWLRRATIWSAFASMALTAMPSTAEEADAESGDHTMLPEIVVTATRIATPREEIA